MKLGLGPSVISTSLLVSLAGCSVIGGFDDYQEVNDLPAATPGGDGDGDGDGDLGDGDGDVGDGDGDVIIIVLDRDGDGVADDLGTTVDKDMDGEPDLFDINRDTILDGIGIDTDGDGEPDAIGIDTDGDGIIDALDSDGDGLPDVFTQLGMMNGDGDMVGPPGTFFSQCVPEGPPFDILDNATIQAFYPTSLDEKQPYALIPGQQGAFLVTAAGDEFTQNLIARYIGENGNPGSIAAQILNTRKLDVIDGLADMNALYVFGSQDGMVVRWTFTLMNGQSPDPAPPDDFQTLASDCIDPMIEGILDRVAFDARSPYPEFAYTCLTGSAFCYNDICTNDATPCVSDDECCTGSGCRGTAELHISSEPGVLAMGSGSEDPSVGDPSLRLTSYVRTSSRHFVTGEHASMVRAGDAEDLQFPQNLQIQGGGGDSFSIGAVPGPDAASAIFFALNVEGPNFDTDYKTFHAGLVHENEFFNLTQSPLPFLPNIFGSNNPDEIPSLPKAHAGYITLVSEHAGTQGIRLTVFDRDGNPGFMNAQVFQPPNPVSQIKATVISDFDSRFLVTWMETNGTQSTLRGAAMKCN